jgi:hypothetical protein
MKHRIGITILADNEEVYDLPIKVRYDVLETMMMLQIDTDTCAL